MKIVKINWLDSGSKYRNWEFKDDWSLEPLECMSVGFLVEKTAKKVVIAQSDGQDEWGRLFVIPKGCITKIEEI